MQKRSAAMLQFMSLYSDDGKLDPVFITNYVTINVLDELSRMPGVGQALLFGKLNYSMRVWFDTDRLTSLSLTPSDIVARDPGAERPGAGRAASARGRSATTSSSRSTCRRRAG